MPSNITPTSDTIRVVRRDDPDLERFLRALRAEDQRNNNVWIGDRWARVTGIVPRGDGSFDVMFEDVTNRA